MPPVGPLRKDDGPACRVCGCTEHNACLIDAVLAPGQSPKGRWVRGPVTCSWAKVEKASRPLCSVCAGTPADLVEALKRVWALVDPKRGIPAVVGVRRTVNAAVARRAARVAAEESLNEIPRSSRASARS